MRAASMSPYLVLLRVGFTLPLLLPTARCALTAPFQPYLCPGSKTGAIGGVFSAALSVGSRPPGVTWHSALWSPDFPPHPPSRHKTKRGCRDCPADFRRQAYASGAKLTSGFVCEVQMRVAAVEFMRCSSFYLPNVKNPEQCPRTQRPTAHCKHRHSARF